MSTIQNNTPLWLNIKPEYLDENLDQVVSYLARESSSNSEDPFYRMTSNLLRKRVQTIMEEDAQQSIWIAGEQKQEIVSLNRLRLLGVHLLSSGNLSDEFMREVFFFFISTLSRMVPEGYVEDLAEKAIQCLTQAKIKSLGFGWSDMREPNTEILAHKLLQGLEFDDEPAPDAWFQCKGSLHIFDGFIEVYASNREDARFAKTSSSLCLFNQVVMVQSAPSDRIQKKDENDLEVMEHFTTSFIRDAEKTKPSPTAKKKELYSVGDIIPVRFLWQDVRGNLIVETVDEDHEHIRGSIFGLSPAFRNYYPSNKVGLYLKKGDCFMAILVDKAKRNFEIGDTFLKSIVDNTIVTGGEVLAVLRSINKKGLMTWWTEDGYPAYVTAKDDPGGYEEGDSAYLYINAREENGYVYATVSRQSDSYVNEDESCQHCVNGFIMRDYVPVKEHTDIVLERNIVRGLILLMYNHQRTLRFAPERFRILCVCRILASMTEDTVTKAYLDLSCQYLKNLVAFALGEQSQIRQINIPAELSDLESLRLRNTISQLLLAYGVDENSEFLSSVIHGEDCNPILVRLASLIQSANRIDDVYPAIKSVIRREIIRFLAVETEDSADIAESAGPDFGIENRRQEFKTSFFFAPPDAEEKNQEKNVFRDICSFLNTSEGGMLYLGVNDNGGVNGLDSDLEYLKTKVNGKYSGLDGYMRYIADRAKQYFSLDVRMHLKTDTLYDGRVVAIRVEPYPFGVVEFEGLPYIRTDGESVKMGQSLRREIEARRIQSVNSISKNVQALQEAIKNGMQVTIHGYTSLNSESVRDRKIEPFAFHGREEYVWGYDLEAEKNKLFRISRMGKVQITVPASQKVKHRKRSTDIFNMTGEDKIPVKLELDMMSKCLVVEEFPEAEKELSSLGGGAWSLETTVFSLSGIGRFYTGLADHIRIIDAPKLKEYAKHYFEEAKDRLEE